MTKRTCLRCGSDRIIPDVPLSVTSDSGHLQAQVHGKPDAWLFKDSLSAQLVAFICGECGHTELKAHGFTRLYHKYQQSLGRGADEGGSDEAESVDHTICLSCNASIPSEATKCPACGWTWTSEEEG